jgi:PPOX class probable F420-dependent enzyme
VLDRLSDEAIALLESATVATVATLNRDGSPHLSLAWIGREGDEVVFGTLQDQRKLRNLRRDARIAVTLQGERINQWGLREYLVLEGTARVTEGGAPELLQHLAHTHIGPEAVFPAMPNPPPGFVTRITVDRISGVGRWKRSS